MGMKRIDRWLLFVLLFPLVGGVAGYWKFRDDDSRLARLLLAGTFSAPVAFVGGFAALQVWPGNIVAAGFAAVAAVFLTAAILHRVFADNPYQELLWACYLCIPGALYVYYGPYSDQPRLRRAVKNFLKYMAALTVLAVLAAGSYLYVL